MSDTDLRILSLAQLCGGQDWRLSMAHDVPHHRLLWITRGQGRVLLDGSRRGVGVHNAIFVPAGSLFALDLGRQGIGHAVVIPVGAPLRLPSRPCQLRVRDVEVQTDLTGLIEAAQREQTQDRPLSQDALEAHVALMSVWLRRQIARDEHRPCARDADAGLSARFTRLLSAGYTSGAPIAGYAESLCVTPGELTEAVTSATGRTAAELLDERVVYAARVLLEATALPVPNIARHLGFGDPVSFAGFVQAQTGQTPGQLRFRTPIVATTIPQPANRHHAPSATDDVGV